MKADGSGPSLDTDGLTLGDEGEPSNMASPDVGK
jgi:hypothetical protein